MADGGLLSDAQFLGSSAPLLSDEDFLGGATPPGELLSDDKFLGQAQPRTDDSLNGISVDGSPMPKPESDIPGPIDPRTTEDRPVAPSAEKPKGSGTRDDPYQPVSKEQLDTTPSGSIYRNPADGKLYRKKDAPVASEPKGAGASRENPVLITPEDQTAQAQLDSLPPGTWVSVNGRVGQKKPSTQDEEVSAYSPDSRVAESRRDDELEQFYASTTMGERIANPLRAGAAQAQQSMAGLSAGAAQRSLDDLDAMRQGKVGGSMARMVRAMSNEEFAAARQARLDVLNLEAGRIAELQGEIEAIPQNPAAKAAAQADTFGKALEEFWRDPVGVIQSVGLQSLPASAPSMVLGTVGAAVGGPIAGAAMMGLGSAGTEYISAIVDELRDLGVNVRDAQAVRAAFQDATLMERVRDKAAVRGGIIGAFDAATFGIGSKTLAPKAITNRLARETANLPAQTAVQAAGGAAGEATAQFATEGEVKKPGAVVMEAIGEGITAPADVAAIAVVGARDGRRIAVPLSQADLDSPLANDLIAEGRAIIAEGRAAGARIEPTLDTSPSPTAGPAPGAGDGRREPTLDSAPPAQPLDGRPSPTTSTNADVVVTPRGRRLDVQYDVVEASQLVASHGGDLTANPAYPAELQPRDRSRAASAEQVAEIASKLEPELLGRSASAAEGAPIIGPDSVIESGNARVLAIRRAYQQHLPGAERYLRWLTEQGFDVSRMNEPVLVRRRVTNLSPEDRIAFTREANERTTATMSVTDQASTDAKALPENLLDAYRGGDITAAANRDFVRGFLEGVVPVSERGALYTREAGLSQEGARRIESALFARAYEDPALLAALREDPEANFRGIGNAMTDAAPLWAQMRSDAARGAIPAGLDVTPALREAVALVRRARGGRNTLADIVNQGDMVSGGVSREAKAVLAIMFRDDQYSRPASRDRVAGALRFYATQARQAHAGPGLFGNQKPVAAIDLLKLARQRSEGGLFENAAEMREPDDRGDDQLGLGEALPRPPAAAITYLRQNDTPRMRAAFDEKYGAGAADEHVPQASGPTASHPPAPRDPTMREIGMVYRSPSDGQLVEWLGDGAWRRVEETLPPTAAAQRPEGARNEPSPTSGTRNGPDSAPAVARDGEKRLLTDDEFLGRGRELSDQEFLGQSRILSDEEFLQTPKGAVRGSAGAGVSYTPFVKDKVAGVAAPADKPIRREDVLRPLVTALGVPLYQGRIKPRSKMLGFYRKGIEEVRIRKMNDIETVAHEIAHLLDDRIPEIRRQWLPANAGNKDVRDELRGVSYDQSKIYEGFAEFVRLWMTQQSEAQARAPKFYGWFEDFVARSEYGPALRKAQEDMHAWFAQDAVSRARSKIGVTKAINAELTSILDRSRQAIFDDLHGILRMEKTMTGEISKVGAYETARLTRSKHSMVEGTLLYGAPVAKPDGSHAFEGKGLSQILDPVADRLDDALLYFVGRSARELLSQGREHLFTKAEIDGMVALETPEFKTAFEEYQDWNRAVIEFAIAKGLINPLQRAKWKRAEYLPFHRVGQPGAGGASAVPGDWKGIRRLTGGTDNIRPVLENIIGNASMVISAALENEARAKVTDLSQLKGGGKFMVRIPAEDRTIKVHQDAVLEAILNAMGVKKREHLPVDVQVVVDQIVDALGPWVFLNLKGQTPLGKNVVAVLEHGKPAYFEVADPVLLRALLSLNRPTKHGLVKILSGFRRVGQASITLTLDFMAANFARDTLMGSVMSKHGFKPFIDSARGMASRVKVDENYKSFIANGGGFSSYLADEEAFKVHLDRFYRRKGIDPKTVLNTPAKLLAGVERLADAFEMSTRLGEYRRAMKKGEHPRHAAFSAREVSTDFGMRGDSAVLGFFYDSVMFLKAGMNGLDRFYRGVVYDENRVGIMAKTATIAALSMGLYAFNRGLPLYDDLEDFDKDSHWHFFIPTPAALKAWYEDGKLPPLKDRYIHLRLPRIWEAGAIGSIAERGLGGVLDAAEDKSVTVGKHVLAILRDMFRLDFIPQAVAPLVEQWINQDRFTKRPIETRQMQDLEPWARADVYTSSALRRLGESMRDLPREVQKHGLAGFPVSPARIEALIEGYFNTAGGYALALADWGHSWAATTVEPDKRWDQVMVIKRFYAQEPAKGSQHLKDLYEAIEAATEARATVRFMDRTQRPELADELEQKAANREYGQLSFANDRLGTIRKDTNKIYQAKDLDQVRKLADERAKQPGRASVVAEAKAGGAWDDIGALKRFLIDDLVAERNELAKRIMRDVKLRRRERAAEAVQ